MKVASRSFVHVSGKRTLHSAFAGRQNAWDPHGVARFDLSELLLGQQLLFLKSPILNCPLPDVLGVRDAGAGKLDGKLVGVAGAVDGPGEQRSLSVHAPIIPPIHAYTRMMSRLRLLQLTCRFRLVRTWTQARC